MASKDIINLLDSNVMPTYSRFPVAFESGKGATLKDFDGKEYIDFASGIGVNSIGYADEKWVSAVSEQAGRLAHVSNLYYTEPCARLAKELKNRTGMSQVFFANSGAESNEGIIKLARKYSFDKYGEGRSNIVTLINSFHGRTVTTLKATGQERFHNYFFPFTEGFTYAVAGDIESVKEAAGDNACAIMMELVQGEGGVMPLAPDFVNAVLKFCTDNDILLLIDEVQTGVGRTGSLFAFQQYELLPDAVSFAKGIGGGLPLGGFMVNEKCKNVLGPGTHATTFGGNPICCAGALVVLDTLDNDFLKDVVSKGEYFRRSISAINSKYITDVRGLGMMIGVEINGVSHSELVKKMLEEGVVCLTAGSNVIRLLPPLTISYEEIGKGLAIFKKVMEEAQ
ncbi:MAG: aspartate aminotransferase family protein [Clostridiales bacterium]|nr:aspartate aminotransferase family protein [Clostridiales bacterium]